MNTLKAILTFLSGKKSVLAGLITTTSAYLALTGFITPELAVYINAMSLILFGSASLATRKIVYNK